jgi:hypothetical protein
VTGIDLAAAFADNMAFPAHAPRGEVLDQLISALASPDPKVRDDLAYPVFATWIARGHFDDSLDEVGDRLAAMFAHPEIQARTFAPLVLLWVIRRGALASLEPGAVGRWRSAFGSWWLAETDIRGYDEQLGWLHAIAHGADLVRAFALSPDSSPADRASLVSLCVARLLAPTSYLFAHAEDDRLAYAMATALAVAPPSDDWIAPIAKAMDDGEPGPVPPFASNAIRTMNALYVAAHRGVHAYDVETQEPSQLLKPPPQVLDQIAEVLRKPNYWLA